MKRLGKTKLLSLLEMYDRAIPELASLRDPAVAGLLRRMEQRRADVITALAERRAA